MSKLLDKLMKNLEKITGSGPATDDLSKSIEELNKVLDTGLAPISQELIKGAALQVQDETETANKYLSDKAKTAMSVKATGLTEALEPLDHTSEKVSHCIFIGLEVASDNLEAGIKTVCDQLNMLAEAGFITSCLAPVSSLALAKRAGKKFTRAIIAYVHVASENESLAKSTIEYSIDSDADTKPLGNLNLDLGPGEFIAVERLTVAANMISTISPEDAVPGGRNKYLQSLIDMWLGVLPKGTELVEAVPCGITDLSVPYELHFRSPVMDKVKEVRMSYVRACGVNSGEMKQGNVILGIQYLDNEGKEVYERF